MERLMQGHIRHFYMALICGILWQLLDVIFTALRGEATSATIILMVLSIVNVIILGSSMIHVIKQRYTECKLTTKIARFTMAVLVIFQAFLCFKSNPSWVALGNHIMTIILIEMTLNYRIKSIEYLEDLADKFSRDKESRFMIN